MYVCLNIYLVNNDLIYIILYYSIIVYSHHLNIYIYIYILDAFIITICINRYSN